MSKFFKIDGKPILPPVIDDERRIELNHYRKQAIEVERQLSFKRQQKEEIQNDSGSVIEETLVMGAGESNYDTSAAVESLFDEIPSLQTDEINQIEQAIALEVTNDSQTDEEPRHLPPLKLNIDTNMNAFNADNLSPCYSMHTSPSSDALNDSRNQSLYFTPMSGRESFSPIQPLIRSNSYVIEKPSAMLLKHIELNGMHPTTYSTPLSSPMSLNEAKQNSHFVRSSIPRKLFRSSIGDQEIKAQKTPISRQSSVNSKIVPSNQCSARAGAIKSSKPQNTATKSKQSTKFKNTESILRSIYEPNKSKTGNTKKTDRSGISMESNKKQFKSTAGQEMNNSIVSNGNVNIENITNILESIEKRHEAKLKALVQQQQEDQKRMHEEFIREQEELVKKICHLKTQRKTESEIAKQSNMLIEEAEVPADTIGYDSNGNRVKRLTPGSAKCSRRLNYEIEQCSDDLNNSYPSSMSRSSSEFGLYSDRELRAATKLAAHFKCYLTRRLFDTEKVNELKKAYLESMLLAIQMHKEQKEQNGYKKSADGELKIHLIQQKESARQQLQVIFHEIPTKERMAIIARDRDLLKYRLNRSKSADGIIPTYISNGKFHLARSQSARWAKKH